MSESIELIHRLVSSLPKLESRLTEHVEDYSEILPHVFMADVVRFAQEELRRDTNSAHVKSLLNLLEKEYQRGLLETEELISVSFLENLRDAESASALIVGFMGPILSKRYLEGFPGSNRAYRFSAITTSARVSTPAIC